MVPERRRAQLVIEKLAKTYARFFAIEPILWELEPMLASGHFQDQIVSPGETDLVVLIVWSRLGTPLPAITRTREYRGIDGRTPVSGTEWEFENALAAQKKRGAPDLLAYRKQADPIVSLKDDVAMAAAKEQWDKLQAFWNRWFVDRGEFRAAFSDFTDLDGFEAKLERDLRKLIEARVKSLRDANRGAPSPVWLAGSPFRGLDSYRFEHAPIFFGRSAMIAAVVEQVTANQEAGRAFLLILGASGAGKSSLAQAGALPSLIGRGIVPGVALWRRAMMRPGGHAEGPFAAMAEALTGETALPELLASGHDRAALARHLVASAADPAYAIVAALNQIADAARARGELLAIETTRLAIVVDQLEELFTAGEITTEQRKAFVCCLDGLARSGRVFVIATMRSDYWHRAAETPLLVQMAAASGKLDLLPATQDEIVEMIRQPAEAAGIVFENDPVRDIRLDATLAAEASNEPGALPLLSFLLDELYKKDIRDGGSTLTHGSMRELGGLKGAIANRAEAAFTMLPSQVQAVLPRVLRALVTVSRSGAEPTARPAAITQFADGSPERKLIQSLLDPQVRLLVADGDGATARIRIAHEALITRWERAHRQIAQDRDDLRTRAIVEEALAEWREAPADRQRQYLLRDPLLAAALDLAKRWDDEFDAATLQFIDASRRRARRVQHLALAAAAVFAFVALFAGLQWWIAGTQRARAERSLTAATQTANVLVHDMAQKFRGRVGMPIDLVRDILDRAQELLEKLVESGETAPALRFSAAQALNEVVLTLLEQGDAQSGADTRSILAIAERFRAMMNDLSALEPDNAEWRYFLSLSENRVGDVLMVSGEYRKALDSYRRAFDLRTKLLQADRNNPDWQEAVATSHVKLGESMLAIAGTKNEIEADKQYRASLTIRQALAKNEPASADRQRELAVSYERVGSLEFHFGHPDDALTYFSRALTIRQELSKRDPNNAVVRRDLAIAYNWVGDSRMDLSQFPEALDAFTASLAIRQKLAAENPSNQAKRDLAVSRARLGDLMMRMGRQPDAVGWYKQSLDIREQLAADDPDNAIWQSDLVGDLRRLAQAGDQPRARLSQAVDIARRLRAKGLLRAGQENWIETLERELGQVQN